MTRRFQLRGDKFNPYHLSVAAVVVRDNKIVLVKKLDGWYSLPSETIYINESLEQCIERGMAEEVGLQVKVERYLGSLMSDFNRTDGTSVEKTTIYFLVKVVGDISANREMDEINDELLWVDFATGIRKLEEVNNQEAELLRELTIDNGR